MKTLRFSLSCLFCLFFVIEGIWGQKYVRLEDASGYTPTAEQLSSLELAADSLCAAFDSAGFPGQFKVYDFGFYLHQELTEGGYPEPFAQKIQQVQDSTPYYLLFGKQTDQSGVYTRFWVEVKLPNNGQFSCITPAKERLFEANISQEVNNKYIQLKKDYDLYHVCEINGIYNLKNSIDSVIKGNCCPITSDQIKYILLGNGYQVIPANFIENQLSAKTHENKRSTLGYVEDYANLLCKFYGTDNYEDFKISLENEINISTSYGIAAVAYITKDENLCDNTIAEDILNGFENIGAEAFIHLHFSPNPDTSNLGSMFIKFKQTNLPEENLPEIEITAPYNECGSTPLPPTNQGVQTYAVTKDQDHYFGYHLLNGQWVQSDTVEFFYRTPFSNDINEREYGWNDKGAWRENLGPGFGYRYHPSFLAWWWTEGPIADQVAPTKVLENRFHFFFQKSLYFKDEKDTVFQYFKYPKLYSPFSYLSGSSLHWECDSHLGVGLRNLSVVKYAFSNIEDLLKTWLISHEYLDSLFMGGVDFRKKTYNISFESLTSDLWAAQIFGGTQGRGIQIKKIQKIQPPNTGIFSKGYEIEFIFTVYDNFGVGQSDGGKWFLPGVIEQWVLQHYRNLDCDCPPCYIPIVHHTAEIFHEFWIWIPE